MTHSHAHSHSLHGPSPLGPLAAKIVVGLLIAIGVVTLAGAAWLWPSQQKVDIPLPYQNSAGGAVTTEAGHVVSSAAATCGYQAVGGVLTAPPVPTEGDGTDCVQAFIAIDSGPNAGANTLLEFSGGPGQPQLAVGDQIRITRQVDPTGTTTYSFYDYERSWPLALLAVAFAVVVVAVARWRGLRALIGIVVAFGVLVVFMLPALRDGAAAIPVALVASSIILLTANPAATRWGATRCQVVWVRGWPWSNTTAGPDPPLRPWIVTPPTGTSHSSNPSNTDPPSHPSVTSWTPARGVRHRRSFRSLGPELVAEGPGGQRRVTSISSSQSTSVVITYAVPAFDRDPAAGGSIAPPAARSRRKVP